MKTPIKAPDLGEDLSIMLLPVTQLQAMDVPKERIHCSVSGCNHYSSAKDFGQHPFYFWGRKWVNLRNMRFYCGKHWKLFKTGKIREDQHKPGSSINHLKTQNQQQC